MNISPKQLLEHLVKKNIIDRSTAEFIEIDSLRNNIPIVDYLFAKTKVDKKEILSAVSSVLNVPYVDISTYVVDPQAIGYIPETIAKKYLIIPVSYNPGNDSIVIATSNPFDISMLDFLESKTGKKIVLAISYLEDIKKAINLAYTQTLSPEIKEALREVEGIEKRKVSQLTDTMIKEAPITKIVNTVLEFAMKSRASDIHIEPEQSRARVRYRIDGILHDKLTLPVEILDSIVSRIKIVSGMKIDEKRMPQDGRFNFKISDQEIDLRVSTLPTTLGEKIAIRLLKKTGGLPSLGELGLRGTQLKDMEEAIARPYGIILVTGPTGSGKTTTLYSILTKLNKPSVNIITIEDPVEYQISGINQVQINTQAGLTFATGLRSFLRQDPNIILVGEIRDKETTQLAIQAALTGHLVFSTLHTNDASTAIPRLIDLGGEPFLIASVLSLSLAQRIVRRICPYCIKTYEPPAEIKQNIRQVLGNLLPLKYKTDSNFLLSKGIGCNECGGMGYLGRVAIFEVLKISSTINNMILHQSSAKDIETQARKEGIIIMKQDGYLKALDGITTIEEILRVAEV